MKDRLRKRRRSALTAWKRFNMERPFRIRPRSGKFAFVLRKTLTTIPVMSEAIERLGPASKKTTEQIEAWVKAVDELGARIREVYR